MLNLEARLLDFKGHQFRRSTQQSCHQGNIRSVRIADNQLDIEVDWLAERYDGNWGIYTQGSIVTMPILPTKDSYRYEDKNGVLDLYIKQQGSVGVVFEFFPLNHKQELDPKQLRPIEELKRKRA